jgi:hypothetical protein
MLNNTSSYYRPKRIQFEVMGLDPITSDFLNWAIEHRDNLETLKQYNTLKIKSNSAVLHFDHLCVIRKIEDIIVHKKI